MALFWLGLESLPTIKISFNHSPVDPILFKDLDFGEKALSDGNALPFVPGCSCCVSYSHQPVALLSHGVGLIQSAALFC